MRYEPRRPGQAPQALCRSRGTSVWRRRRRRARPPTPPIRCCVVTADVPPPTAYPARGCAWRIPAIDSPRAAPLHWRRCRPRSLGSGRPAAALPGRGPCSRHGFRAVGNPAGALSNGGGCGGRTTAGPGRVPAAASGSTASGPAEREVPGRQAGGPVLRRGTGVCRGAGARQPGDALPAGPLRTPLADAAARECRGAPRCRSGGADVGDPPGSDGPGPVPAGEEKGRVSGW